MKNISHHVVFLALSTWTSCAAAFSVCLNLKFTAEKLALSCVTISSEKKKQMVSFMSFTNIFHISFFMHASESVEYPNKYNYKKRMRSQCKNKSKQKLQTCKKNRIQSRSNAKLFDSSLAILFSIDFQIGMK